MELYHFSDDPHIGIFHPHIAPTSANQSEPFVWAIDDWHSPIYCVPRDCPRACFWAGTQTSAADREHWLHGLTPRFVMVVEAGWLERIRTGTIYRYTMPAETFTPRMDGSGHYVSRSTVKPERVERIDDLLGTIIQAGVELRIAERLAPLWRRVTQSSTLQFSGTRLRNAQGYPQEFSGG